MQPDPTPPAIHTHNVAPAFGPGTPRTTAAQTPPKNLPRTTCSCWCDFNELEAIGFCLLLESSLHALVVLDLLLREDGFVVGLAGGDQVEEDTSQLVGGCGNGLGRTELGSHPAVVLSQPGLAAKQRLRGQAQRPGQPVVDPASA